jgi:hypothetical protein
MSCSYFSLSRWFLIHSSCIRTDPDVLSTFFTPHNPCVIALLDVLPRLQLLEVPVLVDRGDKLTKQTARYSRPTYQSVSLKRAFLRMRQEAVSVRFLHIRCQKRAT